MKRNETYGIDVKVEANKRAERCESEEQRRILGLSRFEYEKQDRIRMIFERMTNQLHQGVAHEPEGYEGLKGAIVYQVNALDPEWSLGPAIDPGADFTAAQQACLYDLYLLFVAESATLDSEGLKWVWGNNRTIEEGDLNMVEKYDADGKCSHEVKVQHLYADPGFAHTCDIDVLKIINVPGFKVDGFHLGNVISQATTVFPARRKANAILMHELSHQAMWLGVQSVNTNQNVSIVKPTDNGGFGDRLSSFYDGSRTLPIILSECMQPSGIQAPAAITQKDLYNVTRNTPKTAA